MYSSEDIDRIRRHCSGTVQATRSDRNTFHLWEVGLIDITECVHRFKVMNGVPGDVNLNYEAFVAWLNSLGYRRTRP